VGSKQNTLKAAIAVLIVVVMVLASMAAFYNFSLASANAKVNSLERSTAGLQERNVELQSMLSVVQSRENVSAVSLNPVWIYDNANRSVVTIQGSKIVTVLTLFGPQNTVGSVLGSGFVVKYAGSYFVATNFHVVDGLVNVTETFWNGDAYRATVIGSDPYSDLAVLSTPAPQSDLHPLDLVSSLALRVGQPVVAIGNPFGLSGSVTFGIVSQLGRTIQYQSDTGTFTIADAIQFSAPINPGNSGGPLLDADGFIIGITSAAVTGSQGVGFAIPSDTILRELPDLIGSGKYARHPYFGFQVVDMNYQLAEAMGSKITYGVLIENTIPGGPADKAGLRGGQLAVTIGTQQYLLGGDIIVSLEGTRIVNYDAFATYLEKYTAPGQTVQVGIIRAGAYVAIPVVIGAKPSQ
jgi:S1-C subfamily serine protease